jgi:hypothetical protein
MYEETKAIKLHATNNFNNNRLKMASETKDYNTIFCIRSNAICHKSRWSKAHTKVLKKVRLGIITLGKKTNNRLRRWQEVFFNKHR